MQDKPGVHVVEVVQDDALKAKEELATAAFRQFFPDSSPVRLFRTSDGQTGIYVPLVFSGNPKFDEAYLAVLNAISKPE